MKLKMGKMRRLIVSFSLLFFLSACSVTTNPDEIYEPEADPEASQISSYFNEPIEIQEEIEKEILAEYEESSYSLADPLVKLDPYNNAPLSALVLFETETPATVEIHVGSKKYEESIVKNFEEEARHHAIPVLGLYPDRENNVLIKVKKRNGETEEKTINIQTDPLPEDLMTTELISSHPDAMEEGLTFIVPNSGKIYAVDSNAEVRWYSSIKTRIIFNRTENGHYLQTAYREEDEANSILMERDFLGKIYNAYHIDIDGYDRNNLLHHDVIEMPNGNLLATTHEPDSKYIEDHMHEIDRESGETTQEINVRKKMPEKASSEYDGKNASSNDWLHQNSIWHDDNGRSILISGRSQDSVLKLSYPDGEIEWILAANEDWPEDFEEKLLEPIGKIDFPAGQHAVKVVDHPEIKEQEELKDIILFDNNDVITRGNKEENRQYSQAIRYRINEKERTVEQMWDYGKKHGKDFYSSIVGNVQYLYEQDNLIMNSGAIQDEKYDTEYYGKIIEVDALDNDSGEIFEIDIYGAGEGAPRFMYRVYRYPLYLDNWTYELNANKN